MEQTSLEVIKNLDIKPEDIPDDKDFWKALGCWMVGEMEPTVETERSAHKQPSLFD